jgi:hypothetical protein
VGPPPGPAQGGQSYADLDKFDAFQDEWLRQGAVALAAEGYEGRPVSVFETGGSTGRPKGRISIDDFRIDYEMFSDTFDAAFRAAPTGVGGSSRPRLPAPGRRAPGPAPRRHLLHAGPRPAG